MSLEHHEAVRAIALVGAVAQIGTPWSINLYVMDDEASVWWVGGPAPNERAGMATGPTLADALAELLEEFEPPPFLPA